jgi:hypothetical protein
MEGRKGDEGKLLRVVRREKLNRKGRRYWPESSFGSRIGTEMRRVQERVRRSRRRMGRRGRKMQEESELRKEGCRGRMERRWWCGRKGGCEVGSRSLIHVGTRIGWGWC